MRCPNVCAQARKEYDQKKAEEKRVHNAGSKIRTKNIAKARSEQREREEKLRSMKQKLATLVLEEERLRSIIESSESDEALVQEQKRQNRTCPNLTSALYGKLDARHKALESLLDMTDLALDELRAVARFVERLDPESVDESVKRAHDSYQTWRGTNEDDSARTLDERIREIREMAPSASEIHALISESIYDMLDNVPGSTEESYVHEALYHIPSYLPESLVPYYEQTVGWLMRMLVHLDLLKPTQIQSAAWHEHTMEAMREKLKQQEDAISHLKSEIDAEEDAMDGAVHKYGREGEFRAIQGKCIKKDMGSYTYELCFGDKAAQISNNDGYRFNLGYFEHFDVDNRYTESDDQHYLSMLYANGQVCWNGPPRSARVTLECGEEDALLHVFEAEKCSYSMRVKTPAVCFPHKTNDDMRDEAHIAHDEL